MMSRLKATIRAARRDGGFTLVEIVAAVAIIGLGLVGVSAGLLYAYGGMEAGRQETTATFLAEQRLEQVKATAFSNFVNITAANFPAEAYGTIANAPNYRRTVTITDAPTGITDTKLIVVSVFYRPLAGYRIFLTQEKQVTLSTLFADRK